jgi:hypothetical protein
MLSHLWRELHHVFLLTTGDTRVLRSRGRSCCGWHHFSQSNPRQLGSSQCEMPAPCSRSSSIYHPFFHCVPTLSSSIFEPPASGGALLALRGTEITVPRQWATWDRDLAPLEMQPCPAVAEIGGHDKIRPAKSALHCNLRHRIQIPIPDQTTCGFPGLRRAVVAPEGAAAVRTRKILARAWVSFLASRNFHRHIPSPASHAEHALPIPS